MKITNIKQSHPRLQVISQDAAKPSASIAEAEETLKDGSGCLLAVMWYFGALAIVGFILKSITRANIFAALISPFLLTNALRIIEREGVYYHGRVISQAKHPYLIAFSIFCFLAMAILTAVAWIWIPYPTGNR